MNNCPRCTQPLAEAQVDNYTVRLCNGCRGLVVAHRDMTEILDRSWKSIPADVAEAAQFLRPDKPTGDTAMRCPDCHQPMEKYGYMGLAAVTIDRCDHCAALWLDADELQNMVLALAKSNHRSEKRLRREFTQFDPLQGGATTVPILGGPAGLALVERSPETFQPKPENPWLVAADTVVGILMDMMRHR
jgi:Zn-finger nucleic acid-binding protein